MGLLCGTTETDKRHLAVDTKDSLKSRMRENCKYGSEEGRRQQCRSSTQQLPPQLFVSSTPRGGLRLPQFKVLCTFSCLFQILAFHLEVSCHIFIIGVNIGTVFFFSVYFCFPVCLFATFLDNIAANQFTAPVPQGSA